MDFVRSPHDCYSPCPKDMLVDQLAFLNSSLVHLSVKINKGAASIIFCGSGIQTGGVGVGVVTCAEINNRVGLILKQEHLASAFSHYHPEVPAETPESVVQFDPRDFQSDFQHDWLCSPKQKFHVVGRNCR